MSDYQSNKQPLFTLWLTCPFLKLFGLPRCEQLLEVCTCACLSAHIVLTNNEWGYGSGAGRITTATKKCFYSKIKRQINKFGHQKLGTSIKNFDHIFVF